MHRLVIAPWFTSFIASEARGLRGPQPTALRLERSVRSAHGPGLPGLVKSNADSQASKVCRKCMKM